MITGYGVVAVSWVSPNMPIRMRTRPNGTIRPIGRLSTSEPAIGIVIIAPMPWGATSRPACSVDSPRTSWKYVGTSSSPPKKAAANRNMVMIETVRLRFLNSRRSSSGCSGRNEWKTNSTISAAPISIETQTRGRGRGALRRDRGDAEQEQGQAGRHQRHAEEVEGLRRLGGVAGQHPPGVDDRDSADRHVDQEDPVPARDLDQLAAEDRAEDRARAASGRRGSPSAGRCGEARRPAS